MAMKIFYSLIVAAISFDVSPASAFSVRSFPSSNVHPRIASTKITPSTLSSIPLSPSRWGYSERNSDLWSMKENGSEVEEYKNVATEILSNFMQDEKKELDNSDPLGDIDFSGEPKIQKVELDTLAKILDAELYKTEWFVTGRVNPAYFADSFEFQDPDVKLKGIEAYARGVYKLFDQETSRAEIVSSLVNTAIPNTITITWRLSGKVNIGPGLVIKPYICYTDFTVDQDSGLIVFQEDVFDIPGWDILLSALFPFLIGKVTAMPAPPLDPRTAPVMPKGIKSSDQTSPLDFLLNLFGK